MSEKTQVIMEILSSLVEGEMEQDDEFKAQDELIDGASITLTFKNAKGRPLHRFEVTMNLKLIEQLN